MRCTWYAVAIFMEINTETGIEDLWNFVLSCNLAWDYMYIVDVVWNGTELCDVWCCSWVSWTAVCTHGLEYGMWYLVVGVLSGC